jgi:hypothetical protein
VLDNTSRDLADRRSAKKRSVLSGAKPTPVFRRHVRRPLCGKYQNSDHCPPTAVSAETTLPIDYLAQELGG